MWHLALSSLQKLRSILYSICKDKQVRAISVLHEWMVFYWWNAYFLYHTSSLRRHHIMRTGTRMTRCQRVFSSHFIFPRTQCRSFSLRFCQKVGCNAKFRLRTNTLKCSTQAFASSPHCRIQNFTYIMSRIYHAYHAYQSSSTSAGAYAVVVCVLVLHTTMPIAHAKTTLKWV